MDKQTKFLPDSAEMLEERDADGQDRQVYYGPKGVLGMPYNSGYEEMVLDKNGLVVALKPSAKTTYELVFGGDAGKNGSEAEDRPALSWCTKQHTFKDATLPDGKPNPKPAVVETPAEWKSMSYREMKEKARKFGTYLRQNRYMIEKQKVAIWSANCPEWLIVDLACAVYNWTSVSVYDTLGPDAASYIIADSSSMAVCCEEKTFKRMPHVLDDPVYRGNKGADVRTVVCMGKVDEPTKKTLLGRGIAVVSFEEALQAAHTPVVATPPKDRDLVTIMYTSGTTGMPKGVMLSHGNVVATVSMARLSPALSLSEADVHLAYLPLAHIYERQNCYGLFCVGAHLKFPSSGTKALLPDLGVVRPTLFAGVPKVYENVRDAVKRKMTGVKAKLFEAAMAAKIRDLETGCGYSPLWEKLIFSKTKMALGGRVRFCITGGAPISKDTLQFVVCCMAPVMQGYGCTETSSASTLAVPFDLKMGHVGPPCGTSLIRLIDVPDMNYFSAPAEMYTDPKTKQAFAEGRAKYGGEVWIGGTGVSTGYYDPAFNGFKRDVPSNGMQKKTQEDFFKADDVMWFKTGDIGTWTEDGCLKIVDRRKNMFKTSLGEYIPVEEVEKVYSDSCPYVDFVFLPKETKVSYISLCCVVSESTAAVMKWAKDNKVEGDTAAVVASAKFKELLEKEFEAAAKDKKLQRFMWLSKDHIYAEYQPLGYQEEWVQGVQCANGLKEQLLTATFKARRAQLDQYFAPAFPSIYPDRPKDHILP